MKESESDPVWMKKKRKGKRLNPVEMEEYFYWRHERNHFVKYVDPRPGAHINMPSYQKLADVMNKYHLWKKKCLTSVSMCSGNMYNPEAMGGNFS